MTPGSSPADPEATGRIKVNWFLLGVAVGATIAMMLARRRSDRSSSALDERPSTVDGESASALNPVADSLATVLDALPVAVIVFGLDGRELFRNRAAVAFTGIRHQDVLLDAAAGRVALRAKESRETSETVELAGPPQLVVEVSAVPHGDGAIVLMDDVSERMLVDRIRTDFVANVSHELRTPVGAISILAETLAGETDDELVKGLAGRMVAESERMSHTIDDLLELSRIEMGGEMVLAPVDVGEVVREAVERMAHRAARDAVGIECRASSGNTTVDGDFSQLVTAVSNLLENAVKYSEGRGPVTVTVTGTGDHVEVSVADRGIGIPAGSLERIFERFYRVDRARTRSTGGTGLGLSIVKRVVSNHGGEVNVTSREGEGSTFTVRIPVRGSLRQGKMTSDHERSSTGE